MHPVEEFLQIQIHHPLVSVFQMPRSLSHCRLVTSIRSKPVIARVKLRLVQRFELPPYCLLNHSIDHVGNSQPALTPSAFGYPYPAYISGLIATLQQRCLQCRFDLGPVRVHLPDRLPVRSWGPVVSGDLLKRFLQSFSHCLYRCGFGSSSLDLRQGHRVLISAPPGTHRSNFGTCSRRYFGCLEGQ